MRAVLARLVAVAVAGWIVACSRPVRVMSGVREDKPAISMADPLPLGAEMGLGGISGHEPEPLAVTKVDAPVISTPLPALAPFYTALDRLAHGQNERPVRIMWLGDSHTAADFMTDEVRRALTKGYAAGGPGFVRLGLAGYRHAEMHISSSGRFRHVPLLPAQRSRVADGVFGYGGIRTIPQDGARVVARATARYQGPLRWRLSYRLPDQAALEVRVGSEIVELRADAPRATANTTILHYDFVAPAERELTIKHIAGSPELFGVFVETEAPGVVLDTVGINGARAATVLAWERTQFQDAVRHRQIDLLVLAYGTNEVFDKTEPLKYLPQLREIVEEIREVDEALPCWIVGPPDAATDDGRSRIRVAQVTEVQRTAAEQLGCAFTSAYELMGGERSFSRWMTRKPALARSDRIHLTIAGYQQLGQMLAQELLGAGAVTDESAAERAALHALEHAALQ